LQLGCGFDPAATARRRTCLGCSKMRSGDSFHTTIPRGIMWRPVLAVPINPTFFRYIIRARSKHRSQEILLRGFRGRPHKHNPLRLRNLALALSRSVFMRPPSFADNHVGREMQTAPLHKETWQPAASRTPARNCRIADNYIHRRSSPARRVPSP
jgi:hypothetical protein